MLTLLCSHEFELHALFVKINIQCHGITNHARDQSLINSLKKPTPEYLPTTVSMGEFKSGGGVCVSLRGIFQPPLPGNV